MRECPQELIDAFHLMWDHFPEPCALHHKNRTVVAVNPACAKIGREPGMVCIKHGPPEAHKICRAIQAVKSRQAQAVRRDRNGRESLVYWLPVEGHPDYYIHCATNITHNYEQAESVV